MTHDSKIRIKKLTYYIVVSKPLHTDFSYLGSLLLYGNTKLHEISERTYIISLLSFLFMSFPANPALAKRDFMPEINFKATANTTVDIKKFKTRGYIIL